MKPSQQRSMTHSYYRLQGGGSGEKRQRKGKSENEREKEEVRKERGREWPWREREWWDIFIKILIFLKGWRVSLLLAGVKHWFYANSWWNVFSYYIKMIKPHNWAWIVNIVSEPEREAWKKWPWTNEILTNEKQINTKLASRKQVQYRLTSWFHKLKSSYNSTINLWIWLTFNTFLTENSFYFNEKLPHHPLIKKNVEIKIHYHLLLYI